MANQLQVGDGTDAIAYDHIQPRRADGVTFVFFNALTGSAESWRSHVLPPLLDAGHGALLFDYRGQGESRFSPGTELSPSLIETDARTLLETVAPVRPVLVGLSIGGLFAARCVLAGVAARGLVLLNTLRRDGPRLQWMNDAVLRAAEVGGLNLFRDLFSPLLFNEEWQRRNRGEFLKPSPDYRPIDPDSGTHSLLAHAGEADWNLDWGRLDLPVLVVCGLQDRVFYDANDVAEISGRIPDMRRLDMPDAGHLIPAERPEALAKALLDFARSASRPGGSVG